MSKLISALILCLVWVHQSPALTTTQAAVQSHVPVSEIELLALEIAGASDGHLMKIVSDRGINFDANADFMNVLKTAGASDILTGAVGAAQHAQPSGVSSGAAKDGEQEAARHVVQGILLNRNNFHLEVALPEFEAAVRAAPQNPFAHLALGEILSSLRSFDAAGDEFQQSIRLDPDLAEAHEGFGRVIAAQTDSDLAIREFQEAVRLQPEWARPHMDLGNALLRKGKKDDGNHELAIAQTLAPMAVIVPRVRMGGNALAARVIQKGLPAYPEKARELGVQGVVKFDALIGTDGAVKDLKLISGSSLLIDAASNAVYQWRYKPVSLGGKPVEVEAEIDVNFMLQ